MTTSIQPHVIVIGGGIAGLSTAYALRRRGARVTVLEASDRVGGNIRTDRVEGYLIDAGPDAFVRTKPEATALCHELGLGDQLITPSARNVYVAHRGKLELMPSGMALAVPTRLAPLVNTPLLSWSGKFRALGEVLVRASDSPEDESIGQFFTRRFGKETAERLAGPLLGGIYAGEIDELSLDATFPQLRELERDHGSLIGGLFAAQQERSGLAQPTRSRARLLVDIFRWLRRRPADAPSPFYSLRGGMQQLTDALAKELPEGTIRTSVRVEAISQRAAPPHGWVVRLRSGEAVLADRVALCVPAHVAAQLLSVSVSSAAELLQKIPYVSTATVFLGFERSEVEHPLDGVGFIIPKGESKLMATTWVSSKWEARAPEGHVLLRAFVGGSRDEARVDESNDSDLIALAVAEIGRFIGRLGPPTLARVYRYVRANPQPLVGHTKLIQKLKSELDLLPGLAVAGAAYGGVGIGDCVKQGTAAAEKLLGCC